MFLDKQKQGVLIRKLDDDYLKALTLNDSELDPEIRDLSKNEHGSGE